MTPEREYPTQLTYSRQFREGPTPGSTYGVCPFRGLTSGHPFRTGIDHQPDEDLLTNKEFLNRFSSKGRKTLLPVGNHSPQKQTAFGVSGTWNSVPRFG